MTTPLFRDDAYLQACTATVLRVAPEGVRLDRTVFYPLGGGQAGDAGWLRRADGLAIAIADARKAAASDGLPEGVLHVPAPGQEALLGQLAAGDEVEARIDWSARFRRMRLHTATHLLCALLPYPVDGCSITAEYARMDLATVDPIDRDGLQQGLDRLIAAGHPVTTEWITDEALAAQPELVRTMSVKPPLGHGRVRLLRIRDIDLQPCGGTHVANTAEIGALRVGKIEKKSARTRRVTLVFAS
jgi:misacylated tRNA(Ala) deacylase